jgi:hypothetical protein
MCTNQAISRRRKRRRRLSFVSCLDGYFEFPSATSDCLDRIDEHDDIQRQVVADPESQSDVDHETQVSVIHAGRRQASRSPSRHGKLSSPTGMMPPPEAAL